MLESMARWISFRVSIARSLPSPRSSRYLDLLHELDLEDHVVDDRLLLRVGGAAQLSVEVEVVRLIVLVVALAEHLVAGELVERRQDVAQAQDPAEEHDEHLVRALTEPPRAQREESL
jgi:hypothetical protein